jgi:hypothetical protein
METILENDFVNVYYIPDLKILELVWKRKVSSEEYRSVFPFIVKYAEDNRNVVNYLADIRLQGIVSPDDRKWFQEIIVPMAFNAGVIRGAVVFSGNVFAKYYLNNISGTTKNIGIPLKFFGSKEDAINWFKTFYV